MTGRRVQPVGPQRHDGTDPAGAAGGQAGCEEGRGAENQRHAGERQRVERVQLEQQPAQQAGRDDGERQPERAADDHRLEAAGDEQPHDAGPSAPSALTFASLATPTTSPGGASSRRRTSRPTASPSVQKRRAVASLTMATGRVSGRLASLKHQALRSM